jgi:2-dehydropantoate 2-reductase
MNVMENLNSRSLNNHSLNIGIIGLGAIGCLLRSQIPQKINVFALPSNPGLHDVNFQIDENGQSSQYSVPVWQDETLDVIIICCKATQCLAALNLWQDAINDQSQIVLLQNGMGQHQLVASILPNNTIFSASTTEGAFKKSAQHVVHAGQGITQWGYYSGPSEGSKTILKLDISQLKGQHKWHNTIEKVLLAKLALNSIINPLTVKYDCQNGDLINNPDMLKELEDLCKETDAFFTQMQWTLDFELTERVKTVAKLTANNRSSMLQDIHAQRKTEIDYINGYLLNKANEIGHHLPLHQKLFDHIKSIQHT